MKTRLAIAGLLVLLAGCAETNLQPTAPLSTTQPTALATEQAVVDTAQAEATTTTPIQLSKPRSPSQTPQPTVEPSPRPTPRPTYSPAFCWKGFGGELDPAEFVPPGPLVEERVFQEYVLRIYEYSMFSQSFEVLRSGQRIYAQEGGVFFFSDEAGIGNELIMGEDITGDTIPNLLVEERTGGAHCCGCYYVFQLGAEFDRIAIIDAGHYDSQFTDVDEDGNWEFIVHDWAFHYSGPWPECCSPRPYVILHYKDGGYHLAKDLMRKPLPTTRDLELQVQEIWEHYIPNWGLSPHWFFVWRDTLDLIYSGHPELVEPFLEMVWPDDPEQRGSFLDNVLGDLERSLYWPEIRDLSDEWPWLEQ